MPLPTASPQISTALLIYAAHTGVAAHSGVTLRDFLRSEELNAASGHDLPYAAWQLAPWAAFLRAIRWDGAGTGPALA